jgi:hypothetical protein
MKLPNKVSNRFPNWPLLLGWFVHVRAPDSRTRSSTDSRIGRSLKFGPSTVEIPGFRMLVTPLPRRIKIPELYTLANSRIHRFQASENREFPTPEKHTLRTLLSSTFRVWRVFLNSPTVIFISSVQGTRWVVCCVTQLWVRVLMYFWFCSMPRIVDFIVSTRSISRC